jgi:uncharacterized protein
MERAYSVLHIKEMRDEDAFFVFRGMATTPSPDRVGDVIDPLGAQFAEKIPLLWQHDSQKPVGTATFGKPTKAGIPFTAKIPIIREEGALKTRIDEAIQSVKYALVTGVSIGFRVLNDAIERIKGGGFLFSAIEVMELSLATIPANSEAVISAVKSADHLTLSALGQRRDLPARTTVPGVSGKSRRPIQLIPPRKLT